VQAREQGNGEGREKVKRKIKRGNMKVKMRVGWDFLNPGKG
jgi:hypothetical protein